MALVTSIDSMQPGPQETALDRLASLVADDMARVNEIVVRRMDSPVQLIPQLASYIVASGGKRLRPLLTVAAARLCGYQGERHCKLAAAVEFIHTATLLHDDVVDESDLRRGQASANTVFGNQASVLVGDFLFSRAFELMTEDGAIPILRILSRASAVISEGEVLQLTTSNDTATNEAAYLEVIRAKTAALFAAAAQIGAVVANRPAQEEAALELYGANLGIAFQIVDDVLDYSAHQARLGKTVGDDFREGKVTLPVILAFQRGSEDDRAFWRRTLESLDQDDDDLAHAQTLLVKYGALDDSIERARGYAAQAQHALKAFPDGPERQALHDILDFVVGREY